MLRLNLIFLVSLLCIIEVHSQIVNFSAINSRNKKSVELDSIKITNPTFAVDTTIINNTFDFGIYTGIEDITKNDYTEISSNYPNPFEENTFLNINITEPGTVRLMLTDIIGKIVVGKSLETGTGLYALNIKGSGLQEGTYFLSVSHGKQNHVKKIIKTGSNYGTISDIEITNLSNVHKPKKQNEIQTNDYTLIAYSFGFNPDTIQNFSPSTNNNFTFQMKSLSNWDFTHGILIINNLKVQKYSSKNIWEWPDKRTVSYRLDTVLYNYKIAFQINDKSIKYDENMWIFQGLPCIYCQNEQSLDDTLIYCNMNFDGTDGYGFQRCETEFYKIIIHNNNNLEFIQIKNEVYREVPEYPNYITTNSHKIYHYFKNSSFVIDEYGNLLLKINDKAIQHNSTIKEYYSKDYWSSPYRENSKEEYSLLPYYDEYSYITLVLYP